MTPLVGLKPDLHFANTPGGAQGSAVIFSLIQTAIENGLDPWRYLTWLIGTAAEGGLNSLDAESLLPWAAPEACRANG